MDSFSCPHLIGEGILHIGFVYKIFHNRAGVFDFCASICPHFRPVIRFSYHSEHSDCMRVSSSILFLSLGLTCSFSFIDLHCSCISGPSNWSDCISSCGGLGDAGSWCDADSAIKNGKVFSCTVLLYA